MKFMLLWRLEYYSPMIGIYRLYLTRSKSYIDRKMKISKEMIDKTRMRVSSHVSRFAAVRLLENEIRTEANL